MSETRSDRLQDANAALLNTLKFVLKDGNSQLDHEARLIVEAAIKANAERIK